MHYENRYQYVYFLLSGIVAGVIIILIYISVQGSDHRQRMIELKTIQDSLTFLKPDTEWNYNNTWQSIGDPYFRHQIYSAYFDPRLELYNPEDFEENFNFYGSVRVFAVFPIQLNGEIKCSYRYEDFFVEEFAPYEARHTHENFRSTFSAYTIMCPLKTRRGAAIVHLPESVAIIYTGNPLSESVPTYVPISYSKGHPLAQPDKKLALCIGPMHGNYGDVLRLVEFVEIYRLLGADQIYIYRLSVTPSIDAVLEYYHRANIIKINEWNFHGYAYETEIRYEGILAEFNECVYRATFVDGYKYVAVVDLDEILMPLRYNTLLELLKVIEDGRTSGFVFRNAFFYKEGANDSSSTPKTVRNRFLYTQVKRLAERQASVENFYQRAEDVATPLDVRLRNILTERELSQLLQSKTPLIIALSSDISSEKRDRPNEPGQKDPRSTSAESTEFERISKRTVFDGDSPVGIAVITDSFEDDSGINSIKTGSPHSKDAVVPTAVNSATKSTGAVKKRKERKATPERDRNEAEQSTGDKDQPLVGSSEITSKESSRVVHGTVEERTEKSQEVKPDPSLTASSKVIVHQISKESPSATNDSKEAPLSGEVSKVQGSVSKDQPLLLSNELISSMSQSSRVVVDRTVEERTEKSQEIKPDRSEPSLTTSSKVIVHQISKENPSATNESKDAPLTADGTKVVVHKVEESKTTSHTASKQETIQSTKTTKKKAVRSTTKDIEPPPAKVIIHQISREDDEKQNQEHGQSSKVIIKQISKEEDEKHTTEPSKVIVHQFSSEDDECQATAEKVIVHQISREEDLTSQASAPNSRNVSLDSMTTKLNRSTKNVSFDPDLAKEVSKVILHQISSEDTSNLVEDTSTEVKFSRDLPTEEVKVIAHQITLEDAGKASGDSLKDVILFDEHPTDTARVIYHQIESESFDQSEKEKDSFSTESTKSSTEQFKKSSDTEVPLKDVQNPSPTAGETPKVFVIPILLDNSIQSQFSLPPKPTAESLNQARVSEVTTERTESESSSRIYSSIESTTQSCPHVFPVSTVNDEIQPLDVYFERISRSRSPDPEKITQALEPNQDSTLPSKVIVHPLLQDKETQMSPPETPEVKSEHTIIENGLGDQVHPPPEPMQKTAFPVYRSPKVIVHQIHHEGPMKPVFPLTANSMEKLNNSSKQIAHQILQDVSTELKSTFASEVRSRTTTTRDVPTEPMRTSFPLFTNSDSQVRTSFSDFSALLADSTSTPSPKVIVHQISMEQLPVELKPIFQERSQSSSTSSNSFSQTQTQKTTESPQTIGESKVIVHQISREEEPQPLTQVTSSSTTTSNVQVTSSETVSTNESKYKTLTQTIPIEGSDPKIDESISESPSSKVIVHQILKEESPLAAANKFPSAKEDKHPSGAEFKGFPDTSFQPKPDPALSDLEEKLRVFKALHEELKLSAQLQQRVETSLGIQSDQAPATTFPVSITSEATSEPQPSEMTKCGPCPGMTNDHEKPNVQVSMPNLTKPLQIPKDDATPKSPLTPEESTSSSSSEASDVTAIPVLSPKSVSPPDTGEQEPSTPVKSKSPRSSFFLTSLELSHTTNQPKMDTPDSSDTETLHGDSDIPLEEPSEPSSALKVIHQQEAAPKETAKVIIHPILREIATDKPLAYRVESPQPEQRLVIVKKSKSFDDDDVVIQEMSDTSSAGDTDNPPVVSEAESETDTLEAIDDFPETPLTSRVLSVQTLPIDHEDDSQSQLSPKSSQNYKARRQQNRVALESHFFPQFLSPTYLDSIKEENSDLSDSERRSECSDRADPTPHQGDLEDDVFHEGGPNAKKADAVFPRSNLDFSKKHNHVHTNIRPPKTSVIREEAPAPSVVEAKIIDQGSVEESCSSWSTDLTPESEAAEVVYIDSASSSVSDLLELDYSQGQPHESEDSLDVRIQTPTIDLESINEMFSRPQTERTEPPPPPPSPTLPPVDENENENEIENENIGEKIPSTPLTSVADDLVKSATLSKTETKTTTTHSTVEHTISNEIILEKIETMSDTVSANDDDRDRDDAAAAAASDRTQNSKANNPNSCDSAINEVVANATSDIAVGRSEKMENIREIVSSSVKSELDTVADSDQGISKPDFKIGEPCSDYTLKSDITKATSPTSTSTSSSTSTSTTTTSSVTKITTTSGTQILTLHDLSKTLGDTKHLHPLGGGSSALDRQESLDSHGSDQSQSTNQSQCTAINQGSLPNCEWNEFDTTTDTTYVSGSDTAGLASSENSSPITTGANRAGAKTESPPIKKLRSLCTEALASMPYGEEVLEELATVAKNIGEMPYPLPEIPHIQDIQVSLRSQQQTPTSSMITLTQMPPTSTTSVGQKLRTPPPPPVPEPPSKYESWLGVPTESDPKVLVCLSPSQRAAVHEDTTPDSLLDMHKKFVERRGYHEFTNKQVKAMNEENAYETVTLRKSTSPPPPPLPPRPQESTPQAPPPQQPTQPNGNGTQSEADIFADDQNNHRLLAIIRDTHDSQHQHQHHQQQSTTTSSSENISRRTESVSHTNTKPNTTTAAATATPTTGGGGREEFANQPSVGKQTQERFVSESNQSQSAQEKMQTEHTIKVESEPVMGLRFPSSEYFDSIFSGSGGRNKRFSNIETGPSPGFCSQYLNTQPKRYSNIEKSTFESRKCVENGKVLYDVTDRAHEKVVKGEKPDSVEPVTFPELKTKTDGFKCFPYNIGFSEKTDSRTQTSDNENIMSAFKLNTQTETATAPPPPPPPSASASSSTRRVEASPPAPPVPPLPTTLADTTATTASTMKSTSTSESVINRNFNAETKETIFDDFRQRAKEAAGAQQPTAATTKSTATTKSSVFDHEKVFKDFDELSKLLKDELESGKRRPPATLDASQIPASVSDYNRVAAESKIQSNHVSSSTSEQTRRAQMKKLADEIDRTATQRQRPRQVMRIPIRVEKPTPTPPRYPPEATSSSYEQSTRNMENFKKWSMEADRVNLQTQRTHEIPIQIERETRPTLQNQRSYEIPIKVEHATGARQRTFSERRPSQGNPDVPQQTERTREQSQRFRRAESMFNISDTTPQRHMLHDDWMKYVGDLGSSENICKPFQREVEICYLGRRPNIRAPRLSASTSDLSSSQSYDTYGAYDVRRSVNTQTPRPQQPPRRFLSTQSMIDTTPITSCLGPRRSPVPERRSSLPREIHDQQMKYISSREQQLQLEFERLENERRQLVDEMNRAQINQRINREAYRQRQLPPLTEDESFRQQMAEEWLDKVAQREERRLQKIIKISKVNQDENFPAAPPRRVSSSDIGDEFLRRVKERRSKLCMPSDSDWESGAESQPAPRADGNRSETEEPPVTILEGQSAADLKQLPKHLREFAKLTSQVKEEHHEETTENTSCSATKKSSVVTTVKTTNSQHSTKEPQSLQQDAARARDLEQLPQGKRQKLVTILRHKKPAESSSDGSCQPAAVATATTGGANTVKRRKQTRFLLTPNRRSWSESDLLREIDKDLVLAKGFLYANGVWTPKNQTPTSSRTNLNEFQSHNPTATPTNSSVICENRSSSACNLHNQKGIPTPPPPPLWTPQPERKQFRPVHFESPVPQRRYVRQQSTPSEAAPPPWSYTNSKPFPGYQSQSCTNLNQKNTAIPWPPSSTNVQNGTATVDELLTGDDNGFAPTTSIAEKIRSFERSTSNSELHRPFVRHNPHEKPAILRPNEVIFSVKNEYMSEPETEYEKPKKMAQLSRRQYDGIGPTTNDGMPVVLRSEVKEPNQHEWYKRIFQTIHKQKNPGRYAYKSNGYMSEPEPNYDSDYSTVKYRTLERRRLQSTGTGTGAAPSTTAAAPAAEGDNQTDTVYGTMPNPVKSGQGSYKVQPGRIEDYVTGHSSVSEKEKKEWWDEVMDIFNGWLRDNDPMPRVFIDFANEVEQFHLDQQKLSPHYTQGNLSRALLKEQGYTSDSNLVFRKKDVPQLQSPLSPVEQKQVYKSVQAGGQPPLLGFRKPAPEKPKETEFEYLPITSTLTKIRVHSKEAMSKKSQTTHAAQRELICYPITNVSRPIDMFAPFPKHVPSFIPINQPPLPPNRKSSRTRTTSMALKITSSEVKRPTSANSSRHEACFRSKDGTSPPPPRPIKYGTITLKKTVKRTEPLVRSKSAGAVLSLLAAAKEEKSKDGRVSRKQQTVRLSSSSPVRSASRLSMLRTTSRSPVAFGRSVSKERSFAEEKKRIEETMPSIRTDFTASTNILRDPSLKSPDQVKRAVRSYACPMERSKSVPKALSLAKTPLYMSTYSARRVCSPSRKETSVVRPCQALTSTRSPTRTSLVMRSKSQSGRLPEKSTSKAISKTSSTVSLARTSSTFSVDSTTPKAKPAPKKPVTITRSSTKTETEKAKRKPVTISSSKSDSNVLQKIKESSEVNKKIVKAIPSQQKTVRTNHFFTNLFMRNTSPKKIDEPVRESSVHERARYWNTMSLPPKATAHDSRYLTFNHYRSLSPPTGPCYVEDYETVEQYSDNEASEFGDLPGRTESLVWQYEQGNFMDPHSMRSISDIARSESPAPASSREFSPTREIRVPQSREMRSPSRRRIQSFRGSQRGETGKVIRASSLSSADDRSKRSLYHCEDISHSANSLEYIERHSPSCRFKNSERFIDLNRFYSTLERVGQLERATSATSLKPIRKEGQPMDFEEWRRVRFHERAERELNYLVNRLKEEQKQGDFLFRPKDVNEFKWSGNKDLSLRSKDKSVEDLRENFEKKIHEEWLDESKRLELEAKKDTYKPYWRGSSVADLASSMEVKYNPESGSFGVKKVTHKETSHEKPLCLSNRLISTLSKDQVNKITQQLNEIYNASEPKTKPDVTEEYVITVDEHAPANALKVRCNSTISKEELIGPVLRRKEASVKTPQSKPLKRLSQDIRKFDDDLSEGEKRRLSQTLCREIQGKVRSISPVMLARETRGAIAAEHAKSTLPDIPTPPPLPKPVVEPKKSAPAKPKRKAVEELKKIVSDDRQENAVKIETISKETVEKPEDTVSKKIQYFEERKFEEPAKTIYHAREDSSPDEDEIMRVIEENIKARAESGKYHHQELTSSATDLKDLFGEREASRINFPLPRPPPPPDETIYHETKQSQHRSTSLTISASRDGSLEDLEALFRSRSLSPETSGTSYLQRVNTGEVRKIKDKFESLGRPNKKKHFFALSPLRKVRSDPQLINDGSKDTFKTVVRDNEAGDVSWITHKFEAQTAASRGRSRFRKPGSPIQRMPLRKEDRLMPHIDIISKTASLKQEMMKSRSPSPVRQQATHHAGGVERIRVMFETSPDRDTSLEQVRLGTSSPDLRDISTHLTASWIAHKYPKPVDNNLRSPPPPSEKAEQSISLPSSEVERPSRPFRSRSISPPKAKRTTPVVSILKPRFDFFANQKFDPSIHRPKARYVPDAEEDTRKKNPPNGIRKPTAVKFKDSDEVPPPPVPPTKGVPLDLNGFSNLESPNRYFESDVNIHYKTPIRYESKDPIPEEELAIRQAELMQKLYQEERRRKYLQELQDMNSRRHTDNFTPSQKSPIPLNRYDDFNSDLAPKSPNSSNYPRTVARALYNFQGQTARELTFKKGDVIYIRRQIDKNWYEGEHNAMIGLLPSNYVEILTKDGVRQPPKKPSEGQARAKYNFQAQSGIELSLNKGELVTLTRRVDDNWFEGKIANRKGIFPVSYVEVLVDIGAEDKANRTPATQSIITQSSSVRPSLDTLRTNINNEFNSLTSNGQHPNGILKETRTLHKTEVLHVDTNTEPVAYRALYKYRPQNTDELELQEGDIVFVLEKCDDGWFVGTSQRSGCFGTFPGNYVERV